VDTSRLAIFRSNLSRFVRRLVFGDRVVGSTATSLRNVVAWLFIALVLDAPVPWPAELGLDGDLGL
jgi:hypothetical protein